MSGKPQGTDSEHLYLGKSPANYGTFSPPKAAPSTGGYIPATATAFVDESRKTPPEKPTIGTSPGGY